MLLDFNETVRLIEEGKILHIGGDEKLLSALPRGKWIGGTTPYFMTDTGSEFTKDMLFVDILDFAEDIKIGVYGKYNVFQFLEDDYENGLNIIIIPAFSEAMNRYAKDAPEIDELLLHPTIGWVSGYEMGKPGQFKAYAYDGATGEAYNDRAVVMFLKLPGDKIANVNIINIFRDDKSDPVINFPYDTREVKECKVDGVKQSFAEYIEKNDIDIKMPMVADYNGTFINTPVGFVEDGIVNFLVPVFRGVDYRFAHNVTDYGEAILQNIKESSHKKPVISFNCILNYMYGNLEGKTTTPFAGVFTFGEICYQLLQQTLVYCEIENS